MALTTTTVTGPVYLPNGMTPLGGRVSFELSSWDVENGEGLVITGPVYVPIDEHGQFSVSLYTTTVGTESVTYRMFVIWDDSTLAQSYVNDIYVSHPIPHYTKKYIGSFALAGPGPFQLSELNIVSELTNSSFDAFLEMKAMRDQAVAAVDTINDAQVFATLAQEAASEAQVSASEASTVAVNEVSRFLPSGFFDQGKYWRNQIGGASDSLPGAWDPSITFGNDVGFGPYIRLNKDATTNLNVMTRGVIPYVAGRTIRIMVTARSLDQVTTRLRYRIGVLDNAFGVVTNITGNILIPTANVFHEVPVEVVLPAGSNHVWLRAGVYTEESVTPDVSIDVARIEIQDVSDLPASYVANLTELLASTISYPPGKIFTSRAEGYSYKVVASGGDLITAGGVRLHVVTDGGRVDVKAWGAKADGLTDDAAAIRKAVGSGFPLSWGSDTYRAGSELLFSGVSPDWESDGATIFYDPPAPTQRAIHFAMGLNKTFRLKGKLHLNVNNKAFDGFSATATTVYTDAVKDWPDFVADDLSVTKARRSSLSFVGGSGIVILGGFRRVILTRPVVTNCTMAAGAEVFGAQGIFGITIGRISGTNPISPDYALIQDPYIDYVASDDPAYLNDQDGIRMFSERRRDGIAPDRRQYIVRGGKIKNARNRSIKMQTQNGLIEGVFLEKDQATLNLPNGMTINPDIDWQINGGTTRDITVHYEEATPPEIVRLVTHRLDETFTSGVLDGVSGYIKLNALATAPVLAYANADSDVLITRHDVKVLNVSLKGPISEVLRISQRGVSSDRASVENIDAEITTAIFAPTNSLAGILFAFARNVWNRGASLVPLGTNIVADRIVSAQGCTGFIKGSNHFFNGEGQMLRVESIGPVTPRIAAALVPMSKVLADGEIWDLPRHGLNNGACIMLVSVGIDNSGSGVIGLGNGARSLGVGTSITVGLNTEPASGGIRVWQPSGEGAKIRNMFGSTRTVSVLMFG